jgi:hypothetical protein
MEIIDAIEKNDQLEQRSIQDVIDNGFEFDFGGYINRVFDLFKKHWGIMLGQMAVLLAAGVILAGIVFGGALVGKIVEARDLDSFDLKGLIIQVLICYAVLIFLGWIFFYPFWAGQFFLLRRSEAGEEPNFSMFFDVFKKRFIKILGLSLTAYVITNFLSLALLVFYAPIYIAQFQETIVTHQPSTYLYDSTYNIVTFFAYIPQIYFGVAYILAVPILLFQDCSIWEALEGSRKIVNQRWWYFAGFLIVLGMLSFMGIIACGIGLLVTIPFINYGLFAAYEGIFLKRTSGL